MKIRMLSIAGLLLIISCNSAKKNNTDLFDKEMVEFDSVKINPVFTHADSTKWDSHIRERGFILKDEGIYKLWYTGFTNDSDHDTLYLGYATSPDGINWKRDDRNPVFTKRWTEDMCVLKTDGRYDMFAEGRNDIAHHLTSPDGINWQDQGDLIILKTNGDTIPGPYGTPTVYHEDGKWYLFYERRDAAVWLATSADLQTWKNVQDDAVLKPGPEKFDLGAVAANQVIKHNNKYYMYYHANADVGWQTGSAPWSSNVAVSTDLVHWNKYPFNPIVEGDYSSPITVFDGQHVRLYTMHPNVRLYMSR